MTKQRARQIVDERIEIVAVVTLEQARAAVLDSLYASLSLPLEAEEPRDSIEAPGADSAITFEL